MLADEGGQARHRLEVFAPGAPASQEIVRRRTTAPNYSALRGFGRRLAG
jgi:hypothetical protein